MQCVVLPELEQSSHMLWYTENSIHQSRSRQLFAVLWLAQVTGSELQQAVSCSEQNGNGTNLTAATGCDDTEPSSAAQHAGARAASTSRSRKYRQLAQRPFCMAGSYAMVAILQRNFDKFSLITYNFIITSTKPEFPFVDEQMRGFCAGYVEFHMQCLICLEVNEQNLFQIEYFHFNIGDCSFQCEFQFLIHTRACLKKVNLNKHCNKDTRACSSANKHFKQNLFGTTQGTQSEVMLLLYKILL